MNEGDMNTKFFHKVANGRKHSNTINYILLNNIEIFDQAMLNNEFTNCREIFGTTKRHSIRADWDMLYTEDTKTNIVGLDVPFMEEEIRKAIKDMPYDKALGIEGFFILFYEAFWNVLKDDLIKMFNEFYDGSLKLVRFNFAAVILSHMKIGASQLKDFIHL